MNPIGIHFPPTYVNERLSGATPTQMVNPQDLMTELAEEMGFMVAEHGFNKAEMEEIKDEHFRDASDALAEEAIAKEVKHIDPVVLDSQTRALANQIAKLKTFVGDEAYLRGLMAQYSKGSASYDLALLNALVGRAKDDPELSKLGYTKDAIAQFVAKNERALRASVHIDEAVRNHAPQNVEGNRLKGVYEEAIVESHSPLQSFAKLVRSQGDKALVDWQPFLTKAVSADLSANGVGAEKHHLAILLAQLKGFRLLNTITSSLDELANQLMYRPDGLLQTTLEYPDEPLGTFPNIEKWVLGCTMDEQIVFFQNYRNVFNRLPIEAYVTEEQKTEAKSVLQQRIDELIYSQD